MNLKNGVGTSILAWNIAHILELTLYHHDKAMHQMFNDERQVNIEEGRIQPKSIPVYQINKREFKSGVYDLGADINYGYVRQILEKSKVVVIPVELGAEVFFKTMATIEYVKRFNSKCKIFIVFNKLDNSDSKRERKYTAAIHDEIEDRYQDIKERIQFYYIRYAFALFRNQDEGFYLLDHYIRKYRMSIDIENFKLLQHIRYHKLKKMDTAKKRTKKIIFEIEESTFYKDHAEEYEKFISEYTISDLFKGIFIENNSKIIKDMLILTTCIKRGCEAKERGKSAYDIKYEDSK